MVGVVDSVVAAVVDEVVVGGGIVLEGALPWPPLSSATSPITMSASATTAITSRVKRLRYHGVGAACGS